MILTFLDETTAAFWCPGCKASHAVHVGPGGWGWNGDRERPTLTPSVLVTSGHFIPGHAGGCWCTYYEGHPDPAFACRRCHSFVENGRIRFLSDCSHDLKGQEVDLPEWPHLGPKSS